MTRVDQRCPWPGTDPLYIAYHDEEWGVPEYDDRALYEKLVLDGFQAGLSWITILRKRAAFRKAFHGFDPHKVARYGKRDVQRLLGNAAIIRSKAKIDAAIGGARLWIDIMEKEPGGFSELIWKHVDGKPRINRIMHDRELVIHCSVNIVVIIFLKNIQINHFFVPAELCIMIIHRLRLPPYSPLGVLVLMNKT